MSRLLIVEDNTDLLAIMAQLFSEEYEVQTATSGERALELAQRHRPDAVILDLQLPDMDGIETGRRLKRQAAGDVPILVLTASAELGDPERILASGCCDAYLAKPAPLAVIQAQVSALLAHGHGVT